MRIYLRGYFKKHKEERWALVLAAYGAHCACCGETDLHFLTLDHIGGGGHKDKRLIGYISILKRVIEEGFPKEKYRILCMNCNWGTRGGRKCPHQTPIVRLA
jgi:hypothetical protein